MSEEAPKGWMLHSKGRKFGPLTEDELRGYFRAGMVQSVDRLTAPNDFAMRAAGEVALELGLTPPEGPPPPSLDAPPPVATPIASAGTPLDPDREARAARALAAANIDFAVMASSGSPRSSNRNPWVAPVIAVVALVGLMVVALNMLNRMKGTAPQPARPGVAQASPLDAPIGQDAASLANPAGASGARAVPGAAPAADAAWAAKFEADQRTADQLTRSKDWNGLLRHAESWSQDRPDRNEPLLALGMANARVGNNGAATDALQRVLARDATNKVARITLADVHARSKRWAEAVIMYKELVQIDSQDAKLWNNYGAALTETGQHTQAIAALEMAVKLDPQLKEAWTNLGNTYQRTGDSARAAAAFASAKR